MSDIPTLPFEREPEQQRSFWSDVPPWFVALAGVLIGGTLVVIAFLLVRDDTDSVETIDTTTTTAPVSTTTEPTTASTTTEPTTTSTTTESSTTSTTQSSSTTTIPEEYTTAVWPWFDSTVRYDDPVDAAEGFAEDFVGFDDVVVGEFMQGDARSGEVEVRPAADGPVTTVFVRMLGTDGTWWVLGAATENIEVEDPQALCAIESPVEVAGEALAFEGNVEVQIRVDGSDDPLATDFVTGGGSELAPFDGEVTFTDPGATNGAVVFLSRSARDGSVWNAAVVRVAFGTAGC